MITPCIHFQGNCDEAINFYKEALAAEVKEIFYAKDAPPEANIESLPPNNVMHSEVMICGMNFSLTDGSETPITGEHISFLITYNTADEVTKAFEKLAVGGTVVEPLAEVFWSELYGYVIDRFGVNWQVMIRHQ
ncbi:MAG: VOC family protein [Defluviitaleaceae bacterium]|nr:VOC family protein [Defluviitaleaceae bacterium]